MQHQRGPNGRASEARAAPVVDNYQGGFAILHDCDVEGHHQTGVVLGEHGSPGFELAPDDEDRVFSAGHSHALLECIVEWHLAEDLEILFAESGSQQNQRLVEMVMYDAGD